MRILSCIRSSALTKMGGDIVQIRESAKSLRKLGIEVEECIGPPKKAQIQSCDLGHLWNIDQLPECVKVAKQFRSLGKRFVLSTIHHSFEHMRCVQRSENRVLRAIPFPIYRSIKDFARQVRDRNLSLDLVKCLLAYESSARDLIHSADETICLSRAESRWLETDFQLESFHPHVVSNGVDRLEDATEEPPQGRQSRIIISGRIEPRKNQLRIAAALADVKVPVIFAGAAGPASYMKAFLKMIANLQHVTYAGALSHHELMELYRRSRFSLSASLAEVQSLVDLEAAARGCMIACSSHGSTEEVVYNAIVIQNPLSVDCIAVAINALVTTHAFHCDLKTGTWDEVGASLEDIYIKVHSRS